MFYIWYQMSDVNDVCCMIPDISCQMSDIKCQIWHQMSDNSYMTADVCYYTSDIRRLLTYNCYQMSDVICYVIVMLSDVWCQWCLLSDIRRLMSDVWYQTWYDIRYLITLIWLQLSEVSLMLYLMLYNCYQPSDVRRLMWWTSYDIRRLITVIS